MAKNNILSRNKLYKLSGCLDSYSNWLVKEKDLFEYKKKTGKLPADVSDFDMWLNMRYQLKAQNGELNAIGDDIKAWSKSLLTDVKATVVGKIDDKINESVGAKMSPEEEAKAAEALNQPIEKRILGLKPPVFYGLTAVVVIGAGIGIYYIIKKKK